MKIKAILVLFALFLCFNMLSTSVQAASETAEYYIDISVFPDSYAEFEIIVNNHANFSCEVIGLPVLECENDTDTKYISSKIRVTDIYGYGTLTGKVDLNKSCGGITVIKPINSPNDFTVSFIYDNFDWEPNPKNYPLEGWFIFEGYRTHILLNFPEIGSDDKVWINTINILLPPNTEAINISASRWMEHPRNTAHGPMNVSLIKNVRGSQQILSLEYEMGYSNKDKRAIYIPLEFKRCGYIPIFFIVSTILLVLTLLLLTIRIIKEKDINPEIIFTIVIIIITFYQFLASDKPAGFTTILDMAFLILTSWSLGLVVIYLVKKFSFWTALKAKIIQFYKRLLQKIFKFRADIKKFTIKRGEQVVLKLKTLGNKVKNLHNREF